MSTRRVSGPTNSARSALDVTSGSVGVQVGAVGEIRVL